MLVGVDPLLGLLVFTLGADLVMGLLGERVRGRDAAIGVVLAFSVGLGVLFLKLYTQRYATEVFTILFGTILGVSHRDMVLTLVLAILTLAVLAVMYLLLLFASLDPKVAAARGVPVRLFSMLFLLLVAVAPALVTTMPRPGCWLGPTMTPPKPHYYTHANEHKEEDRRC